MTAAADHATASAGSPDLVRLVKLCHEIRHRSRRQTWIEIPFGDGTYRFELGRRQIDELERACGYAGPDNTIIPLGIGAIFSRVAKGRAFIPTGEPDWANINEAEILASEITERDCLETIRLALIGGNRGIVNGEVAAVSPARVRQLMDTYLVGQPLEDAWHYAFAALGARIFGVQAASDASPADTDVVAEHV